MKAFARAKSDWIFLSNIVRLLYRTMPILRHPTSTVGSFFEDLATRYGERVAIESERGSLTFRALDGLANRVARWAAARGLKKGEVVALLMPNRIEYLSIWIGVAKAGGATALVNTSLVAETLAQAIRAVSAKILIVDASFVEALAHARQALDPATEIWSFGEAEGLQRLDLALEAFSDGPLAPEERPALTIEDRCLYIYTSGTTGLPKAANLNHYRVLLAMRAFAAVTQATASDRMYDCLPMYHSNGGVLAPGAVMLAGGTCVIRERFSARDFWPDIARSGCTTFVYIGELCRYLLQVPPGPADRAHRVRLCFGNGLRPDVWTPFRERFGLRHIREFYGSTEGNCSMFNFDSHPHAVGRVPWWIESRFPMKIVRFDIEAETEVRGPDGLCVLCGPDEIGEVVGEIVSDPTRPGNRFEGYADRAATASKVLHDVVRRGDSWFRTGDLMRRDSRGYYYFVDRVGDTFRWKGENVSTMQVAEVLGTYPGVKEAVVYGVTVPGSEGRAGMACIAPVSRDGFDVEGLRPFLAARLPRYAVPVFVRLVEALEKTGTFKQRKVSLAREGFDPAAIGDPIYFAAAGGGAYRPLGPDAVSDMTAGRLRL